MIFIYQKILILKKPTDGIPYQLVGMKTGIIAIHMNFTRYTIFCRDYMVGRVVLENLILQLLWVLEIAIISKWIGKEQVMINCPAIYFHDTAKYFRTKSPTDFTNRLHSEYKFQNFLVLYNENQSEFFLRKTTWFGLLLLKIKLKCLVGK